MKMESNKPWLVIEIGQKNKLGWTLINMTGLRTHTEIFGTHRLSRLASKKKNISFHSFLIYFEMVTVVLHLILVRPDSFILYKYLDTI